MINALLKEAINLRPDCGSQWFHFTFDHLSSYLMSIVSSILVPHKNQQTAYFGVVTKWESEWMDDYHNDDTVFNRDDPKRSVSISDGVRTI